MDMHNAMKCGYDYESKRRVVRGDDFICSRYVRSVVRHDNMFGGKVPACMKNYRPIVGYVVQISQGSAHRYFPNKAIKLRRLPIFFTFSVLRSG